MLFLQAEMLGLAVLTANAGESDAVLPLIPVGRALVERFHEADPIGRLDSGVAA